MGHRHRQTVQAKIRYCWTGHLIRVSDEGIYCLVTKFSHKLTYCDEKIGSYMSDHILLNFIDFIAWRYITPRPDIM